VIECPRQPDLTELGGAVDGLAGQPAAAGLGGDRNQVALAACDQVRDRGAKGVDGSLQIDVDHLFQMLDR